MTPAALDGLEKERMQHDRVMLGSDHPFWMGDSDPLRVVRDADLDPAAQAAIFGENAAQIFRLSS